MIDPNYWAVALQHTETVECPICYESIPEDDRVFLACCHVFDKTCIDLCQARSTSTSKSTWYFKL